MVGRFLAAVAALAIVGCGGGSTGSSPQNSASSKPIVIGMTAPLTGALALFGKQASTAAEAWAETVNASGGILGRKVQVKVIDDTGDPQTAVTLYQQMLDSNSIEFAFGTCCAPTVEQVSTVMERRKMVFINSIGTSESLYNRGFKYLFLSAPFTSDHIYDGLPDIISSVPAEQRPKTAAMIAADQVAAVSGIQQAQKVLEAVGIKTVFSDRYPLTAKDLGPLVQRVKAANPDMVVQIGLVQDTVLFTQAFYDSGTRPKLLVSNANAGQLATLGAGKAAEGAIYPAWWQASIPANGQAQFLQAYTKQDPQHGQPDFQAANTWTGLQILQQAVKGVGSTDQAKVRSYLASHTFDTIEGKISYDDRGVAKQRTAYFLQWQNGKPALFWPKDAAGTTVLIYPLTR